MGHNALGDTLHMVRVTVNNSCAGVEPWKLIAYAAAIGWALKYAYDLTQQPMPLSVRLKKSFFFYLKKVPAIRSKIQRETAEAARSIEQGFVSNREGERFITHLPKEGATVDEVIADARALQAMTYDWENGTVSGTVYNGGEDLRRLATEVYGMFTWANPLHPDVFPGTRKMEAEVVQMCVNLYHGNKEACGTMTTGGTESILMACKAYRDRAYETKGITHPNMVIPVTAHAAFDKAGGYFGIRVIHVDVDPQTGKVDLRKMRKAINSNTVMLVGSAPGFPHGIVDPIEEIAKLGLAYDIGVHVDCCLGGFILPFMKDAGFDIEPFDFRVNGVTSISCDTHKYGCAPKGTSVVMYSTRDLRHYQYFSAPDWTGGIYASPSILGSRPGALLAATWATMIHIGYNGYVEMARKILTTAQYIKTELADVPGLQIMGDPKVTVIALGSDTFDIYRLSGALSKRGWNLNSLQNPPSLHICLTNVHTKEGVAERFLKDVKEETAEIMKNPGDKASGMAAIYGMAATIPDKSIVSDITNLWLDTVYKVQPGADT
eukprot:comp23423_c0_seq1/m.38965 comp23423_c0_seq1/g.38965  ORF comp23423_c0_seq1/g.38965 comp23423_c0_seq1/m.38965 type:complete len:547 (-) comp23423_c0_seq1:293-1933(-)